MSSVIPPTYAGDSFTCPHCNVCAAMHWEGYGMSERDVSHYKVVYIITEDSANRVRFSVSVCERCRNEVIWVGNDIVYPNVSMAPPPHVDMPEQAMAAYEEAASILPNSARASLALLRLSLEHLVGHIEPGGDGINDKIARLVKRGMDKKIQQSLDSARILGNEAVHVGEIDVSDPSLPLAVFGLLNIIVQTMVSDPSAIDALYQTLPESKRAGVEARDKRD